MKYLLEAEVLYGVPLLTNVLITFVQGSFKLNWVRLGNQKLHQEEKQRVSFYLKIAVTIFGDFLLPVQFFSPQDLMQCSIVLISNYKIL